MGYELPGAWEWNLRETCTVAYTATLFAMWDPPHPECPSQVNLSTTYGQTDTSEGRSLPKGEEFQQAHAVVWMTIEKMPNKSGEMWILVQGTQRG